MDLASVIGLVVAIGMILAGNAIEGGKIAQIAQPTAAMIVIGGTVGATMLQFPLATFIRAMKQIRAVFFAPASRDAKLVEEIVSYAATARRDGILALEPLAPKASDPFLVRALMMAIDGADSNAIRDALEQAIHKEEEEGEDAAKVFETAGGYAPTIGIIGAVLGLIQVMQNLSDIAKVGEGIATAFVATIYGVAFANLVCLPIGGKLKLRTRGAVALRTLMLEGALAIQQGMNPKLVKERLASFSHDHGHAKEGEPMKEAA
jgi:chemotaxis protein MotA